MNLGTIEITQLRKPRVWTVLKVWQLLGQLTLGIVLLWWIAISIDLNVKQLVQTFKGASWIPLTLAVCCFATTMFFKALQYHCFLHTNTSRGYLTGLALSQNAFVTFLPWRVGEMSLPLLLRKDCGVSISFSLPVLIMLRSVDLFVAFAVFCVVSRRLGFDIYLAGLVCSALAIIAIYIALRLKSRLGIFAMLKTFIAAVEPIRSGFRTGSVLLLAVGIFILTTLQSTLALRAMGLNITIADATTLNVISLLAAVLPIHPPGGWGTIDSIQFIVLQQLNYQPEIFVPVILATHCFYTVTVLVGGIIGWLVRGRFCFI